MNNTSDPFYPTVDFDFLEEQILKSNKIISNSKVHFGSTIAFERNWKILSRQASSFG